MSENLKQFKKTIEEAAIKFFADRYEDMVSRSVYDTATHQPVPSYLDEDLSSMKNEITLTELREQNGITTAFFTTQQDGKAFDFIYATEMTIMTLVMQAVLED